MTDAPERIRTNPQGTSLVTDFGRWETDVEYHRSDLTAAAVAAALQGAVAVCGLCMGSGYGGHPDSGAVCCACGGGGAILAQIDPTGLAALEARDARVRAEALEEAAAHCDKVAETTHDDVYWGVSPDREVEKRIAKALAATIRAIANTTAKEGGE